MKIWPRGIGNMSLVVFSFLLGGVSVSVVEVIR